jgi:hypothetical protein
MGQVLLSKFIGLPRDVVLSQIKPWLHLSLPEHKF